MADGAGNPGGPEAGPEAPEAEDGSATAGAADPSATPGTGSHGGGGWPLSAICAVLVCSILVAVLLLMNLVGVRLNDDGYDPDVGGSMAEWFEAFATLLGVPAAVVFGVRQLQSTGAVLELERRQLVGEEQERVERRRAERALLQRSVSLRVQVGNVLDAPDLATDDERRAVERLTDEYLQRGWVRDPDAGIWRQGPLERTNAEQLAAEPTPLAPAPWFVCVECRNSGAVPVVVETWTLVDDDGTTTIDAPVELPPGGHHHQRLGEAEGFVAAYRRPDEAADAARSHTLVLEGVDARGHPFRIVHRPRR